MSIQKSSRVTFFKVPTAAIPSSNAIPGEFNDVFAGSYWSTSHPENSILEPPYPFETLEQLVERNSTIQPCVAAYTRNIAGTGYTLVGPDGEEVLDAPQFTDLFNEISPGKTLLTLLQETRPTLETTGNAFLEIVRDMSGEVQFVNLLPTASMRLVRFGDPVEVTRNFLRNGEIVPLTYGVRERAYVQAMNDRTVYFREFGSSQHIDKETGKWSSKDLPLSKRGNEIIHLTVNKAAGSPYGVPRWINQTPAVMGSREAEENNSKTVSSGGMHNVWVFLKNVYGSKEVRDQIMNINNTAAANKQGQAAVIELQGEMSGDINGKASQAGVEVVKFDSGSASDAMYERYGITCREQIMSSFRLHKLFIGIADSINRATAEVIYTLTEAQVFKPERDEFDEIWNMSVMRAIDPTGSIKYRSKPVVLKFTEDQLKALALTKGSEVVLDTSWLDSLNSATGLQLVRTDSEPMQKFSLMKSEDYAKMMEGRTEAEQKQIYRALSFSVLPAGYHDPQGALEIIKYCGCGRIH